jgi:hypothetical protein
MLDAACFICIEDVVVQRAVRSATGNQLLPAEANAKGSRIRMRTNEICDKAAYPLAPYAGVIARGLMVPNSSTLHIAALWGHWDLLQQARLAGVPWGELVARWATTGGHLGLLRRRGCPWIGVWCSMHFDVATQK